MGKRIPIETLKKNKYGRLTILDDAYTKKRPNGKTGIGSVRYAYVRYVDCKCDCGKRIVLSLSDIVSKHTQSCGCLFSDTLSQRNKKVSTTHGDSIRGTQHQPLYNSFLGMHNRCNNRPEYTAHKVCKDWANYLKFKEWSLDNDWDTGKVLHHEGTKYSPDACQWLTKGEHTILHKTDTRKETNDND